MTSDQVIEEPPKDPGLRACEQYTFYLAKGKPWHFAVLALALAGHLAIAFRHAAETGEISLASIFPFVVLLPFAAFAFRGHYDRRPVLKISSEGIWFSAWNQPSPVPWTSVVSVKEWAYGRGEPFIALRTNTERLWSMPRYSFRVTRLDIKHKDALRLTEEYWRASTKDSCLLP